MDKLVNVTPLVPVAQAFASTVGQMEDLVDRVPSMPTDELAAGYANIKAFETGFKDLVETIRNEMIGTQTEDGTYKEDGRIFKESNGNDAKGNKLIAFLDGTVLKASMTLKTAFDEAKALEILEKYDCVEKGCNKVVSLVPGDPTEQLLKMVNQLVEDESGEGNLTSYESRTFKSKIIGILKNSIDVRYIPVQEKMEALVVLGIVPASELEGFFKIKKGYSLLVDENPYKPKKKKKK